MIRLHSFLLIMLFSLFSTRAAANAEIDLVRVLKKDHKLQLLAEGSVVHEFPIALGKNPKGHKEKEGDGRTPEGVYTLDLKKRDSSFYRAIRISYPNEADVAAAREKGVSPGGQIMIHGQRNGYGWLAPLVQRKDWTQGCVALTNGDMEKVWKLVKEGTPIEIHP